MNRKYGIEIEFVSDNYTNIIDILKKYNCVIRFDCKYSNSTELILKPEGTVRGCELNIPPDFNRLEELCEELKSLVSFTERCAMHIHVDSRGLNLDKLNTYYINNEASIISQAGNKYVDLNFSNTKGIGRKRNMNIFVSSTMHNTVEHRIYKSTFNYNDIVFAINQTLNIIEESQK